MRRVASLFLPTLATDRLRRLDARAGRRPEPDAESAVTVVPPQDDDACSCPRGGGWRPGARWAQQSGHGAVMAPEPAYGRDTAIAQLPAHQRPPLRELGRRSEAADHPFKAMRSDEVVRPVPDSLVPRRRPGSRDSLAADSGSYRKCGPGPRPSPGNSKVERSPAHQPPLVTAAPDRQRMAVVAVDAAAATFGLTPGMAVTYARALVAGLDVRDADPRADRALLDRLVLIAVWRWAPVAMAVDDGLVLDITGSAHLHGGEAAMARGILRFCRRIGLDARIAVAGTVGAAHALARYGREPVTLCPARGETAALADLPVQALRLEPRQRDTARRLGIERIGDLFAMPRGPLVRRFGASLVTRLDQATGRAAEPIDALVPYRVPEADLRFAEPIAAAAGIAAALAELATRLAATLTVRGLGARTIRLSCVRVDGVAQEVTVGLARGTRDARHMLRLLAMKIETIDPGFGIEAMRLTALRAEPLAADQMTGDLGGSAAAPDLAALVDRIVARLGMRCVFRPSAVESDVPERSVRRIDPLAEPHGWPADWPRPVRMLRRPERIDGVIALMPDQPPKRFTWRGCCHVVTRADGPERIAGEWWKRTSETHAVRDYFRLEDEAGRRFWVFRRGDGEDPRTGDLSWHMAGLFG